MLGFKPVNGVFFFLFLKAESRKGRENNNNKALKGPCQCLFQCCCSGIFYSLVIGAGYFTDDGRLQG